MNNNAINYMKRALQLAQKGEATVSPNPLVGAVIVKNGKIIGEGYHIRKGEGHAEVNAVKNANECVKNSTLYCTLEPCCHTNKTTPPCTELIIERGISEVVIAALDPNPEVAGKGVKRLEEAGVKVSFGLLEKEAKKQNKVFFKNMTTSLPYIHIKSAVTLDGRIATSSGDSKWISSSEARGEVHEMRNKYDAVMIGKNTLRADNPSLNTRQGEEVIKENIKVIVGTLESTDTRLKIFSDPKKVINITKDDSTEIEGVRKIQIKKTWKETFEQLYRAGVCSLLVEGGSALVSSLLKEDAFDELTFYVNPKLVGNGPSIFVENDTKTIADGIALNGKWRLNNSNEAIFEVMK